jgi:hypothetical protein
VPDLLDGDALVMFDLLNEQLSAAIPPFDRYLGYYRGQQRLEQLGLAIPPELRRFIVIVNWPRIAVDGVAERLERRGFQMPGQAAVDPGLWDAWVYNQMDAFGPMGDSDALKFGRSYRILGANALDREFPRITVESPREVTVYRDPYSSEVVWALKRYGVKNGRAQFATLYGKNETWWLDGTEGRWVIADYNRHDLGACPVVPIVNRPEIGQPADGRPLGTSEMDDIINVTDAAARNLTNAQVAQETHATPQRVIAGAKAEDFVDPDTGEMLPVWQTYFGAVWAMTNPDAKASQFSASDMKNFETMQDLYARQAAALAGMPPNYFGLAADDASSADAIRSREAKLIRKCEMVTRTLGAADKWTMRLFMRIRDGEWAPDAAKMRVVWESPATPTLAQRADATVKLFQAGIIPLERAQLDMGYTPDEIADMAEMAQRAASDPVVDALAKNLVTADAAA